MENLIIHIAKKLVETPDAVQVKRHDEDDIAFFNLSVAEAELGKVIGKQGRTVRAMRTLLNVRALKEGTKARLDVGEQQS